MRRWPLLTAVLCFACKPTSDAEQRAACDVEQLRATTTAIATLPPSERGRAALDGLQAACKAALPQPFVAHYEAKAPRTTRLHNPATQDPKLEPLIRNACADWDTLRAVQEDAPPDQRALASFLACDAKRFDIAEAEASGFASLEVTWALHQWLLDRGIDGELARPITLALLAYERERASPVQPMSGLELPKAVGWPLHEGVTLYVSPHEIRVGGESILELDGTGRATSDVPDGQLRIALTRAFDQVPRTDHQLPMLIAADARTPFATMLDVVDLVSATGQHPIELVVSSPEQGPMLIRLKSPLQAAREHSPIMSVEITADGQHTVRGAAETEPTVIAAGDREAFLRFAQTVERQFPSADTVILSADPELPLQRVVDVMVAVRGSCEHPETCVLGYGLLSRTPAHEEHAARGENGATGGRSGKSKIEMGDAKVSGKLDQDIIRRIVGAHRSEVRTCHQQGLAKNPALAGTVTIKFTIASSGKVSVAAVQESTLDEPSVGNCIAKAVKRWTFPKPTGGGNVTVVYPFELAVE